MMAERAVAVNGQHIPAWLIQHPQFIIGVPLEATAVQNASQIKIESCGTRFGLYSCRNEFLPLQMCRGPFDSPEGR